MKKYWKLWENCGKVRKSEKPIEKFLNTQEKTREKLENPGENITAS